MAHRGLRQLLFAVLTPLLAGGLTLGAIELALAIAHPAPSPESGMRPTADPYTGFRFMPHSAGHYPNGVPAVANGLGLRDVEMPLQKPPGVFRILVLGDSFTAGANVPQEEVYAKVLERKLRGVYGARLQVVNAGVGGWGPFQYAQYFEHAGYQLDPDLILIGFFVGNDTFEPPTRVEDLPTVILGQIVTQRTAARPFATAKVFLYRHSRIVRVALNIFPPPGAFVRERCDDFTDWHLAVQRERMPVHLRDSVAQRSQARNAVDQIQRIRRRAGDRVPVVVALLPDENQVNPALPARLLQPAQRPHYDFTMPQSMLVEMFRGIGLRTIDVLPAILAGGPCLYMNETHWSPRGHEVAAAAIYGQLAPMLSSVPGLQ